MAKVSVAITTYNRLNYLRECLDSVLAQTFQDFLVYIFDDASRDPVEELIKGYGDERIKFLPVEHNLGASKNIQRVFNYEFETPYVIVFHDDDAMAPVLLEREVEVLEQNPDVFWIGSGFDFRFSSSMMKFSYSATTRSKLKFFNQNVDLVRDFLGGEADLAFGSVMYRQEALKRASLDFGRFGPNNDRPFLVELTKVGRAAFIENKLMNYRVHLGQDSRINPASGISSGVNLMQFYKTILPNPLSRADKRLFYTCATNNLLDSYLRLGEARPGLKQHIRDMKKNGVMNLWYLNRIGLRAIFKNIF